MIPRKLYVSETFHSRSLVFVSFLESRIFELFAVKSKSRRLGESLIYYSHSCECRGVPFHSPLQLRALVVYTLLVVLSPQRVSQWLNSHSFRKSTRRNGFVKFSPPTSPSATLANPFPSAYSTPCSKSFTHNLSPARHRVAVTRVRIVYYSPDLIF